MRITHLKVNTKKEKFKPSGNFNIHVRESDYQGQTKSNFDNIDKSPFGRNKVPYSENGGYYGSGGFVYYFSGDLTIANAKQYFDNLVEDGLFNNSFLALTLEMIVYNENYETGVQIVYQFLHDNSGHIEKYTDASIYNKSMYKSNFRKYSSGLQILFKGIDFIYLTGILIVLLAFIRKMYMRIREF